MEEKKVKISLNQAILIIVGILIVIFGVIFYAYYRHVTPFSGVTSPTGVTSTTTIYENTKKTIPSKSDVQYDELYSYYPKRVDEENLKEENLFVTSHEELKTYLSKCFHNETGENNKIDKELEEQRQNELLNRIAVNKQPILTYFDDNFFKSNNLAIQMSEASYFHGRYSIISVTTENLTATINMKDHGKSVGEFESGTYINFIVLDKKINHVNFDIYRTTANNNNEMDIPPNIIAYKPIIYLYPTKEEEVMVKLLAKDRITVSYPKYNTQWKVLAKKNGSLIDLSTNRNLYSLYYECKNTVQFKMEKDGFIIKGEESATFLEEKLAVLGLTEREAEEFIIYWLPKLEANKYNYIRFATSDEINENMPFEITPNPDTIIRILMTYKGLNKPIKIEEQKLITPDRKGFVAVEWGGTEIE